MPSRRRLRRMLLATRLKPGTRKAGSEDGSVARRMRACRRSTKPSSARRTRFIMTRTSRSGSTRREVPRPPHRLLQHHRLQEEVPQAELSAGWDHPQDPLLELAVKAGSLHLPWVPGHHHLESALHQWDLLQGRILEVARLPLEMDRQCLRLSQH